MTPDPFELSSQDAVAWLVDLRHRLVEVPRRQPQLAADAEHLGSTHRISPARSVGFLSLVLTNLLFSSTCPSPVDMHRA